MKSFYRRMVEEKGMINEGFRVVVDGVTHYMSVEFVIELIENASTDEQRKIKSTFSSIDFYNGDLMHYIKFLAKAFIKTHFD